MKTSIFLSTDGKHTVNVEDETNPEMALKVAQDLYGKILEDYGTQTEQRMKMTKKVVNSPEFFGESVGVEPATAQLCKIHQVAFVYHEGGISAKTGKAYHSFWSCPEKMPDGSYCKEKPQA